MPRSVKRVHELIDLTGDDDTETRSKRPARAAPSTSNSVPTPGFYPGSQSQGGVPASQASFAEPDYLDLTQESEGPPFELYGTFGAFGPLCVCVLIPDRVVVGKIVGVRYYNGYASPGGKS